MDFKYISGQTLLIELTNEEIYEGVYESGTKDRIDVTKIYDHPDRNSIPGMLSFYRSEILNIRVLNESIAANDLIPTAQKCENRNSDVILLNKNEYNRLQSLSTDHTYICTMDKRYFDATDFMNNCETVAVVGLNVLLGRMSRLSLLVMATWDHIFIFDLQQFAGKTLPSELQAIFESEHIKKVLHGSRTFMDCLYHVYNIKSMKNIFDTEVADLIIQRNENGTVPTKLNSLSDCLTCYLNFPSSILETAINVKPQKWKERPISNSDRCKGAQLAAYLITLKNCMEQIIMKDVYKAMQVHCQSTINLAAYDSSQSLSKNKLPEELLLAL